MTEFAVNGSCFVIHCPLFAAHVPWLRTQASRPMAHGSWLMAQASWLVTHGSSASLLAHIPDSWILGVPEVPAKIQPTIHIATAGPPSCLEGHRKCKRQPISPIADPRGAQIEGRPKCKRQPISRTTGAATGGDRSNRSNYVLKLPCNSRTDTGIDGYPRMSSHTHTVIVHQDAKPPRWPTWPCKKATIPRLPSPACPVHVNERARGTTEKLNM